MIKRRPTGDVLWYFPNGKRPIARSTKAASDLIVVLSQEHTTIQEVHDAITYDMEAKNILKLYIEKGYGDSVAKELFW